MNCPIKTTLLLLAEHYYDRGQPLDFLVTQEARRRLEPANLAEEHQILEIWNALLEDELVPGFDIKRPNLPHFHFRKYRHVAKAS